MVSYPKQEREPRHPDLQRRPWRVRLLVPPRLLLLYWVGVVLVLEVLLVELEPL